MPWSLKHLLLLAFSGILLITGSMLLWQQAGKWQAKDHSAVLKVKQNVLANPAIKGAFTVDLAKQITFQDNSKDVFTLTLVKYRDQHSTARSALLFRVNPQDSVLLPSSTGQRHAIWQDVAAAIAEKAPKDALFLSWWDDSQRLHFLTGRDTWLTNPGAPTFTSELWRTLQMDLTQSDLQNELNIRKLARWLTMDSGQALQEMARQFGKNRPVYLAVNKDLLMRLAEMTAYGGSPLQLFFRSVPASDNLHNDISRIKQLAQEAGDGNYLVQKEGAYYRVWITPKQAQTENHALLIRLLPFVESLKQLPDAVKLVYQSHWGGYFSIYRLDLSEK